jgi:hypothetical protein
MDSDNSLIILPDQVKFHHPFSMSVCGPTTCGKTYWVYMFLNSMKEIISMNGSDVKFQGKVMYCFSVEQQLYNIIRKEVDDVVFFKGIPELENIYKFFEDNPGIIILDDLMYEIMRNVEMLKLFTQGMHHYNISVIFMSQNVFQQGMHARTIALNVKYLVLFYNPRDKKQIKYLGDQIYPGKGNILLEAYLDAVSKKKWGYLLLDLSTECLESIRMRTDILPYESDNIIIYKPSI